MSDKKPKVHLIGKPQILARNMRQYLQDIGAGEWLTDAISDAETLIEFYGRVCYNSFKPGLNPNVTKVREGNQEYIQNIIKQVHG